MLAVQAQTTNWTSLKKTISCLIWILTSLPICGVKGAESSSASPDALGIHQAIHLIWLSNGFLTTNLMFYFVSICQQVPEDISMTMDEPAVSL